ncbi:uncharacterized protein LOC106132281 [Amyelois transitella]|uniref:uncharacterized protein LOC106132281 n=1 Tax=Amyelois transitella TaxID=680683 RepID=UPI00298FE2F5|nr:uncharacterized protein LOC106132281 [Amyelois transitella]
MEISAAIAEMVRLRDKKVESYRQQLGSGITAVSKAMSSLMTGDNKIEAIKTLSDGCRILCDLHHSQTQSRIKMITPGLAKSFLNVIQDSDRDETLFGISLPEKIKASKSIEKQGLQIKKPVPVRQPPASQNTPAPVRQQVQGNWVAPPRYASNRGGARNSEEVYSVNQTTSTNNVHSNHSIQGGPDSVITDHASLTKVHAGRIQHFYKRWLEVTNNDNILDWVRNGIPIPFTSEPVQHIVPRITLSAEEQFDMSLAIDNLLYLGAISPVDPCEDQFISSTFLAPKSNGEKRFILNLKSLNRFIPKMHFKMEDFRTTAKLLQPNWFMATIDLKESYLLIPIDIEYRKYLRFQYIDPNTNEIVIYEFNAMPYGLAIAPRCFTKIVREVVANLRSRGYKSICYLDDVCCIASSYYECHNNIQETITLFEHLGFVINYEKSQLVPKRRCKFLGFIFDTTSMTISLPADKRDKIAGLIRKFHKLPTVTIRELSQLIGVLVSACPAVRYGWLYTKILERQKYLFLHEYGFFDTKVKLRTNILEDLNWWLQNIFKTSNPLKTPNYAMEIFTDASRTGWGAYYNGLRVNGAWKDCEISFHINYLELLSIFLALKCFARDKTKCAILLRVDNTTAISYINRMGGIQFPHLNNLAREIWRWCELRQLWLFASYINTKENIEADEESRRINNDIEWELSASAFNLIVKKFGQPEIDLFASRTNAKCHEYVSWKQDPDAVTVDAFTIKWNQKIFYAFPPFSLLLNCIQKIIEDEATGILVFPMWPAQAWYPQLMDLLISDTSTPSTPDSYPGSSAALRCAFSRRGVPPTALRIMLASLSDNTLQQYGICYKLWYKYSSTLVDYMSVTDKLRPPGLDHLLMTVKRPHKNATAQTISRWIKQTLSASGVDVAVYGAHSTRHAATSKARVAGLSLDVIRKTAGSEFFGFPSSLKNFPHIMVISVGTAATAPPCGRHPEVQLS